MHKLITTCILVVSISACASSGLQTVAPEPVGYQQQSPCASFVPTHRVHPKYPRAAAKSRQNGWVALTFDVSSNGRPMNIKVAESSPAGVFDAASITALEQWQYPTSDKPQTGCRQLLSYKVAVP